MRLASFAAVVLAIFALAGGPPALAQQHGPDTAAQRAAMERLAPLVGQWHGEAAVSSPASAIVYQTEQVEHALDGLLLLIRGVGHETADRTGAPVFQALGVISYDPRRSLYEVRAYTHDGRATTATGEFLDDGSFRWGFAPGGPVQIRFTITFDEASWRELGEMSRDNGATWTRTVELDLHRTN